MNKILHGAKLENYVYAYAQMQSHVSTTRAQKLKYRKISHMDAEKMLEGDGLSQLFTKGKTTNSCFEYGHCYFNFTPCSEPHVGYRYNDASAAWVLVSAIIVFFMKAGFLLIELAFAKNVREKRHVVVVKHLDAFASAFGFFLFGFDFISQYHSPQSIPVEFFKISDPVLWFFKFTFASNAATILGGCLVTSKYKLRLPAAFLSAFLISGIIHPCIARIIWTDRESFSVYRFCNNANHFTCGKTLPYSRRMYVLDFGGGGAVHMLGGVAGLVLCLFAKLHSYLEDRKHRQKRVNFEDQHEREELVVRERPEAVLKRDFWEWMYPVDGGNETTSEAALGVLILWFCWFAFNCGTTESIESKPYEPFPYHAFPSIIAVNMILAAASGGIISVLIASWAQIRAQSDSVNANEIANGVLSALVAISAGCPFVDYWAACVIGDFCAVSFDDNVLILPAAVSTPVDNGPYFFNVGNCFVPVRLFNFFSGSFQAVYIKTVAVIVYHIGCWIEYRIGVEDTARVIPVHGLCGLWSMLAVGVFMFTHESDCRLHATFEGLCFCHMKLPYMSYGERLGTQVIGTLVMIGITACGSLFMYGFLYLIPIKTHLSSGTNFAKKYNNMMSWIFMRVFNRDSVNFEGNLLFTGPGEIPHHDHRILRDIAQQDTDSETGGSGHGAEPGIKNYGSTRETLGTREGITTTLSTVSTYTRCDTGSTRNGTNTHIISERCLYDDKEEQDNV